MTTLREAVELLRTIAANTKPSATMIDRETFAELIGIAVSTFDRIRATGEIGPLPVKIGGSLRWHRGEVDAWLSRRNHRGELYDAQTWPAVWQSIHES